MISVADALTKCLALVAPLASENIPLTEAAGRILTTSAHASRAQPPFAASAMDGYAVCSDAAQGDTLTVIGEAAAGHGWSGSLHSGQAVRIFTGAPIPTGATRVVIQENVQRHIDTMTITDVGTRNNIRPAGADFPADFTLRAPRCISASDLALLAAMNIGTVRVTRKPTVALIATGDELLMPGSTPAADQIIASNIFALKAMIEAAGGIARILPIARDNTASLHNVFTLAQDADLIVTIGGASVGDHDLVGQVANDFGLDRAFYKIAMRPGKPLMAGTLGKAAFLGLPGNPVSAVVCGHLFLLPMIRAMLGRTDITAPQIRIKLANALTPNGPRAHYMRATVTDGTACVHDRQDSALLTVLADANCLIIRPPP